MISFAGINISVQPDELLTRSERQMLRRQGAPQGTLDGTPPLIRVTLADVQRPGTVSADQSGADGCEARVTHDAGKIEIHHDGFSATVNPLTGDARVERGTPDAYPLEITIRTALCCVLPRAGGLPVHAAAVVVDGRALVFFGSSGAGKSTLAEASPYPVLSDELVAICGGPKWIARSTGFWGECGPLFREKDLDAAPVDALVELVKGPEFRLERMPPGESLRRLLHVMKVPAVSTLWRDMLARLDGLINDVPIFRMEWHSDHPPWSELQRRLEAHKKADRSGNWAA